ncbi:hypothetical protein SLEP1_g56534 [Rubroshorea leprosula]|uniref:Succinate dehydogenase/fumarate reductase N-terminal domain-containing protein n=1 Tax=Rubroshorea leprosula TaxID=152421 RepID=A0AAV5MLR3_9ROSI|nr:hypothetical protein SLEP1_g56534 [Rubroshorea leprosula]
MNIDGCNGLACLTKILSRPESTITLVPHMFVIKDLVVDMTNFCNQYKNTEPWLKRKNPPPVAGKEILQSKKDIAKLDGMYECIHNFPCSSFFFLLSSFYSFSRSSPFFFLFRSGFFSKPRSSCHFL